MFKGGVVRAVSSTFIFGGARLIIVYLIVLPFTLSGNTLTPKSVITTISLIYVIRLVFIISVVRCFFVVYEAYVAIVRIQVFTNNVYGHVCMGIHLTTNTGMGVYLPPTCIHGVHLTTNMYV